MDGRWFKWSVCLLDGDGIQLLNVYAIRNKYDSLFVEKIMKFLLLKVMKEMSEWLIYIFIQKL